MVRRDLYERLGVRKDASEDAIKRAYFRLAKKFHPDLNKSPQANERFLAVKEAYETLSSPLLRREYDDALRQAAPWEVPPPRTRTPARVIRVTAPYVAREPKAVRVKTGAEERKRRQLAFAYTAVTAGMSVVFLGGAFLFVALGGVLPGIVSFLMGLSLVLVLLHVIPLIRPR